MHEEIGCATAHVVRSSDQASFSPQAGRAALPVDGVSVKQPSRNVEQCPNAPTSRIAQQVSRYIQSAPLAAGGINAAAAASGLTNY